MEHILIQKDFVPLENLFSALSVGFPTVKFSVASAKLEVSGQPPCQVLDISYRHRLPVGAWDNLPDGVPYQIREYVALTAIVSTLSKNTYLGWFDDDLGSASAICTAGGLIAFQAETESFHFSLQGGIITTIPKPASDADESRPIYHLLDAGLRSFFATSMPLFEVISEAYHASTAQVVFPAVASAFSGDHPILGLWNQPQEIFTVEQFALLVHETRKENPAPLTVDLALAFLRNPACRDPRHFSQALVLAESRSFIHEMESLIANPVRPGDWILAFVYSNPSVENFGRFLANGRPHCFVALESLEYILSNGDRPGKLIVTPLVRDYMAKHSFPVHFSAAQRKEVKDQIRRIQSSSRLGPRETKSVQYCLAKL